MVASAGGLIFLVVLQAWGDALDGRSVRGSWRRSAVLVATFVAIVAGAITVGDLLR